MPLLARILLEKGFLTRDDLQKAILNQIISGKRLGRILIEEKLISDVTLNKALSIRYGVEPIPPDLYLSPNEPVFPDVMEKYAAYPWNLSGRFLMTALLNPSDKKTIAQISYRTGKIVKPFTIPETTLRKIYRNFDIRIPEGAFYRELIAEKIESIPQGKNRILKSKSSHEVLEAIKKTAALLLKDPEVIIIFRDRMEIFGKEIILELPRGGGTLSTVINGMGVYIGKPRVTSDEQQLFKAISRDRIPENIVLIPVILRRKIVNVIIGELWKGRENALPDLISLSGTIERKYEELLKKKWEKIKVRSG